MDYRHLAIQTEKIPRRDQEIQTEEVRGKLKDTQTEEIHYKHQTIQTQGEDDRIIDRASQIGLDVLLAVYYFVFNMVRQFAQIMNRG